MLQSNLDQQEKARVLSDVWSAMAAIAWPCQSTAAAACASCRSTATIAHDHAANRKRATHTPASPPKLLLQTGV
eukprot:9488926-Pyramimonas_sp.AAC.1